MNVADVLFQVILLIFVLIILTILDSSLGGHRRVHKKKGPTLLNKTTLVRPEQRQMNGHLKVPLKNGSLIKEKIQQKPVVVKEKIQEEQFDGTIEDMPNFL